MCSSDLICFELGKVLVCFCIDSTLLKAPPSTALFWCLGRSHQQQPSDRSSSPTGPIKPWVDYSRKTCCCLHHNLPLGVHQLIAINGPSETHVELLPAPINWSKSTVTEAVLKKFADAGELPKKEEIFWRTAGDEIRPKSRE